MAVEWGQHLWVRGWESGRSRKSFWQYIYMWRYLRYTHHPIARHARGSSGVISLLYAGFNAMVKRLWQTYRHTHTRTRSLERPFTCLDGKCGFQNQRNTVTERENRDLEKAEKALSVKSVDLWILQCFPILTPSVSSYDRNCEIYFLLSAEMCSILIKYRRFETRKM